ncbi:hypothetical protein D3C76_1322310 [compost metagenome]
MATAALRGTSTSTVGSKKVPPKACGLPPATTRAPLLTASSMCSWTLAMALASIKGPVVMPFSRPLPMFSLATATFSFSTKASYTPSWMYRRLAQTQVWPLLRYLETSAPSTAASRSASSNTMNGALPPSSRDTFLMSLAHSTIN